MKKNLIPIFLLLAISIALVLWWKHNSALPYYYTQLELEGGMYQLKKIIRKRYRPIKAENNTGIVRVYFQVSEKGVIKNIRNEQYSLNYKKTALNQKIVDQLVEVVRNLKGWSEIECAFSPCYSFKFFTFKVINGEVLEILPK